LCALVPPPRFHMLRYHGVLAAHAEVRADVVPGREPPSLLAQLALFELSDPAPLAPPPPARHPWAWLLKHVFAADVTVCPVPGCEGRMRVVEIATAPDDIARVRGARARSTRRPRAPPRASVPTERPAPPRIPLTSRASAAHRSVSRPSSRCSDTTRSALLARAPRSHRLALVFVVEVQWVCPRGVGLSVRLRAHQARRARA
jgi:hypothetical protein